ncbi:MAG: zinc-ribbon domain-containing protein [Oscillibacter sp.]|nr:zinc-ribbon domain-containing protein [Oscillibacter sp.]MCI9481965.1 zinc-ribbon domain-containing protein [Oscillibacter sp.]
METSISNRSARGHNCPYCTNHSKKLGSIAEERPALIKEWDDERNSGSPQDYSARSNKKVWWKCMVCGYNWQISPDSRFCGSGCPVCARKRRRIF